MKKILWDISNTEKISLRVALFLEHKPQNLPSNGHFNISNATLRNEYSYLIWNNSFKFISHVFISHEFKSVKDIHGGIEPV